MAKDEILKFPNQSNQIQMPYLYLQLENQLRQWIKAKDKRHLQGYAETVAAILQSGKTSYSKYRSNPPQHNLSKRLKAETTMMKPIKSILISNSINSHSDSCIKSLNCTSFSRANNFF